MSVSAQQDQQFTQFYFNRLNYNPAYAGYNGDYSVLVAHRSQWMGLEGAPTTQVLSFDAAVANKRVGLGASIVRNNISIEDRIDLNTSYSYRLVMGGGTLSIGISANIRNYSMDFGDNRLVSTQDLDLDDAVSGVMESKWLPNFGAGIYFESERIFLGASAPRLLENNIDFDQDFLIESRQIRHVYVMAGLAFDIGNLTIQPMGLLKMVKNAPFDADASLLFTYKDNYTLGATYRLGGNLDSSGESLDMLAAIKVAESWLFGISYDLTLSDIKRYQNGTLEFLIRFTKKGQNDPDILNPRFF
jgi:type IX secretion system PorP/SprF family membrane protein